MPLNTFLRVALVVLVALWVHGAKAEIVQAKGIKLDVPAAWTVMPSASARSIRLKSPDKRVEITVYVHSSEATREGSLEQLAQRYLEAEHQAQKRIAKNMSAGIADYRSSVSQDGERWRAQSSTRLTTGIELRGLTILERGHALSVGAESQDVGQSELEDAMRLVESRITK